MNHYCFEGVVHNSICECNCLSCFAYREAFFLKEFNRELSKRIKKANEVLFLEVIKCKPSREALIKELKKQYNPVDSKDDSKDTKTTTSLKKSFLSRIKKLILKSLS